MSQLSKTSFGNLYGTSGTTFPDNTTGQISEGDVRTFGQDTADSFLNKTDGGQLTGSLGIGISPTAKLHTLKADNSDPHQIWTNDGGANNEYLALYNFTNEYLLNSGKNGTGTTKAIHFGIGGSDTIATSSKMHITTGGNVGIGLGSSSATAKLHLPAGTATANTAPLKLTTGTALGTPEDGALEYHSSHLYFTIGSTRYQLDQQATAGTYTPTLTSQQNVDSSSANLCQYMRVGSVVTVSGRISVDPTAGSSLTRISISLPVASAFADGNSCGGTALSTGGSTQGYIKPNTSNGAVDLEFTSTGTTNDTFYFIFNYLIV